MKRLLVTGMSAAAGVRAATTAADGRLEVDAASDFDGAVALTSGAADYYIGICQSGAGAAIAMAIGLLGSERARSVSAPGARPTPADVEKAVAEGVVAFGIPVDQMEVAIPLIVRSLLAGGTEA